ncbi:MAG TPA: hypothetical protein VJT79_03695, partial [Pseudonocardia sp.]|nr:hypothetical protein [Pseudonocardia sp.]
PVTEAGHGSRARTQREEPSNAAVCHRTPHVRHEPDLIAYVVARAAAEFPIEAAVASGEVRE